MTPRHLRQHPATLLALVTLAVLGAATATPWRLSVPETVLRLGTAPLPETETPSASPAPSPEQSPPPENDTLLTLLLALAAAALALLLWHLGRTLLTALRRTDDPPPDKDHLDVGDDLPTTDAPTVPLPELTDAVTRALSRLDDAPTPEDAVISAWLALEDAAAEHGTRRHPAQTPTEFTQAVLDHTPAPPTHVATLRRLYAHARFTDHPTDPEQVTTARHALTAISTALDTRTGHTP